MQKRNKFLIAAILFLLLSANNLFASERFSYPDTEYLKDVKIFSVASENENIAWGTKNGIVLQKNNKFICFNSQNSPLIDTSKSEVAICEGNLWVAPIDQGNGYGVFQYSAGKWKNFRRPTTEGMKTNKIVSIHVDEDKVIWFGYNKFGVGKFVELIPPRFTSKGLMHFYKHSLLCLYMQKTHLWIGSINGIVRLRSETPSRHFLDTDTWKYPDFPARSCYDIQGYGYDKIIAGTDRGIAKWNGKEWTLISKKDGILSIPVKKLVVKNDTIWLGGNSGLQSWSPNKIGRLLTVKDGLPSNNVTDLCLDQNGNLLIATDKGAAVLNIN